MEQKTTTEAKYKRILLKLSGESLQGKQSYGHDVEVLNSYAEQIKDIHARGVEIGIVIGGGNIFRGIQGAGRGFDRVKGDQMGMLATVINSLALQSALESVGVKCKVLTSIRMEPIGEYYSKAKALEYLEAGYVVIIGGGTSNPYFSTDTASALRGIEIEADVMFKGTRVDGIYTADPEKDPTATKYDVITFDEVLAKRLKVMYLPIHFCAQVKRVSDISRNCTSLPCFRARNVSTMARSSGETCSRRSIWRLT